MLDCFQYYFVSVNTRQKNRRILKLSLYFDRVNIKHLNKMELFILINNLISILSLWLGFSFKLLVRYARKSCFKLMRSRQQLQAPKLFSVILLIGLPAHVAYIRWSILDNDLVAVTFFQPSQFIIQPMFSLCFELEHIKHEYDRNWNREETGNYLWRHTQNLSHLVRTIRFLDKKFDYKELNASQLDFETTNDHFEYENIRIKFFWYFKYKCYEFEHTFEPTQLSSKFPLDTVFLQFDLKSSSPEFELMFYADKSWSLENCLYIPAHSLTILRYIAVYTIPVNENLTFCLHNQNDESEALISEVRDALARSDYYKISTKLLPLTYEYFDYPIRDEVFYNALNQVS